MDFVGGGTLADFVANEERDTSHDTETMLNVLIVSFYSTVKG